MIFKKLTCISHLEKRKIIFKNAGWDGLPHQNYQKPYANMRRHTPPEKITPVTSKLTNIYKENHLNQPTNHPPPVLRFFCKPYVIFFKEMSRLSPSQLHIFLAVSPSRLSSKRPPLQSAWCTWHSVSPKPLQPNRVQTGSEFAKGRGPGDSK